MDEKVISAVNRIKLLAEQNSEFRQTMQKLFGTTVPVSDINKKSNLSSDIAVIRSALEIRANASITYDFVSNQRLRDQLLIDNLRMENAALNLQDSEAERFYVFCVNAFYQVENILNYFYYTTFPELESLLKEIEDGTLMEKNDFKFRRTGKEQNVGSIPIVHKLNAFFNSFLPTENSLKWSIGTLRQVRNEGEHRCDIIRQEKDENNNLYRFFKTKTFNYVRSDLVKFVNAIENKLSNPEKEEKIASIIKSILPSACYVLLRGQSVQLPDKLFAKVRNQKKGNKIQLTVKGDKIIDVGETDVQQSQTHRNFLEEQLQNIVGRTKWIEKSRHPFTSEEIAAVESAVIVAGEFGNLVCFHLKGGGKAYIPLSLTSNQGVGESVDLSTAKIITLERDGETFTRVEAIK